MRLLMVCTHLLFLAACGSNVGESTADKNSVDEALVLMEQRKWDEAISILENELSSTNELNLVNAVLASAYAGKYEVDHITYAAKLGESADEGQNNITKTFSALPEATDENIAGVEKAIAYINAIPDAEKTPENIFIASMLYSVHLSLISKKYDTDGGGGLTREELSAMTAEEAGAILESLSSASELLAANDVDGANFKKAAEKLGTIQEDIDNQPGSELEQVQGYLANE